MKLIIQVPCYNEAGQLPATLAQLPRSMPGFDAVEWLVIDDGSDDDTARCAVQAGVHHIVRFSAHRGLAEAFAAGLEASCRQGADVIVNLDADNQYRTNCLASLCQPVLAGEADIVVGCRPIDRIEHFSLAKKGLQRLGSAVLRMISGAQVDDATSGFRAYSRRAALALNVYSSYTYTLETLVQAGGARLVVIGVPVEVNPPVRPSRLISSTGQYLWRSMVTMLRSFVVYRPLRFFLVPALLLFSGGTVLGLRFIHHYFTHSGAGHVQSLVLASILIMLGALCVAIGLIADLLSVNRRLLEDIQASNRRRDWTPP